MRRAFCVINLEKYDFSLNFYRIFLTKEVYQLFRKML